jgi:hypothetical protein
VIVNEGTRIYWTGDMANLEGFGTVTKREVSKWGVNLTLEMDDGRKLCVSEIAFSEVYKGHGGTRFVTLEAYNKFRSDKMKKLGFVAYSPVQ